MNKIYFLATCCLAMCLSACSGDGNKGTENGHEWVDLGLPSGTKWATCNIGATKPEEFGNYYAWGEVTPKEVYDVSTSKYGYDKLTKYNIESRYGRNGFADGKTTLELEDDAAHFNWGGKWRMPTQAQQDELRALCYWVWTESYNGSGVKGYIVYKAKDEADKGVKVFKDISPLSSYSLSDAHIFMPAAGDGFSGDLGNAGSGGYWSSSLNTDGPISAWSVNFYSDNVSYYYAFDLRFCGQSVRAVIPGE